MRPDSSSLAALIGGAKIESEYVRFDQMTALVIDDIGAMRNAIRFQLQSFGCNIVHTSGDAEDALRLIQLNRYDLVLCDYNLNKSSSGQHFLEFLRQQKLLSAKTIFVMVTAEAEYGFVANAVEFSPDDYILKPCPERKLRTRLERLFDRRAFLMPALEAMDAGNHEAVSAACDLLIARQPDERWLMHTLRLQAEAQLALGDTDRALLTYQQAAALRDDAPWVAMGIARTRLRLRDLPQAELLARSVIDKTPNYVAAYELLAQIMQEQKDYDGAFAMLELSTNILPTAKRYRGLSEAAALLGKLEQAKTHAQAAIRLSTGSMVEHPADYLGLAQIQTDLGEHKAAMLTLEKTAQKYGEAGTFGVTKNAILAQAYFACGETDKARKLLERAQKLLPSEIESAALTSLGKAALKTGDFVLGLKLLTQSVQVGGAGKELVARHVARAMIDSNQSDKIEDVIDGGQRRILALVDEAIKEMRVARFQVAYLKILDALAIHAENIEALLAAAQLHLLWLKQDGMDEAVAARARTYLASLDRLVPNHPKVMGFYRFFNELAGA